MRSYPIMYLGTLLGFRNMPTKYYASLNASLREESTRAVGDGHLRIQPSHRSGCHATYVSTQAPIQPQPHNIISLRKGFVISLPSDLQPRTTHDTPPHSEAPTTDHTYTQVTKANSPIERRGRENPPTNHHIMPQDMPPVGGYRPVQYKVSNRDAIQSSPPSI